ncbi:HAMP domain-containing sensor histidine kinase [Fusobacterium sp.]|uniref:sensor histidine kinase n=1 Tax=Fusobacterium sp. TaxID=68766 RepID=UPI0028FFDEE0|nr:HAMP domain-containing sensor histidine kinase [Fusobacterium sp.]MDU1911496.1 HAMP domain-containing sensor histidine kinase [Fusobacterium sp.]
MKKLSDELQKSHYILVFIFSFSCLGLLYIFASYMIKVSSADITTTNIFIDYELNEFTEKLEKNIPIDELFKGALEECPKIDNVFVIFTYQGKIYSNSEIYPKELQLKDQDKIQNIGFYDYQSLHRTIYINGIDPIDLKIIKDLKGDKLIFFRSIGIAGVWIIFTLIIGIYISKKFYNKFIPPLRNIQEITNKINLDSLDTDVKTENNFIEFISIIHSYKNMLNRLKKQTDAQIDFVNSASHELKTPIFIIGGYVDLIKRWGASDKNILMESLDSIEDETKNMSILVTKLLFLAKDNKDNLDFQKIFISDVLKEIIGHLKLVYPKQEINFIPNNVIIYSDPYLIKQLFLNLMENAVKYGLNYPIDILVSQSNNVTITIEDHGMGISKEDVEHIFDRFFRVDKARSRNMGSHGLGLSIVKNIIEVLKGDLEIKSKLNKGTTVHVTLPFSLK